METIQFKNIKFTMWDVGGQGRIRPLWRYYFQNTQGLIYVVDSTDSNRIPEAKEELHHLVTFTCTNLHRNFFIIIYIFCNVYPMLEQLQEDELRDAVVLIYANKQDLPYAKSTSELAEKLDLLQLKDRKV